MQKPSFLIKEKKRGRAPSEQEALKRHWPNKPQQLRNKRKKAAPAGRGFAGYGRGREYTLQVRGEKLCGCFWGFGFLLGPLRHSEENSAAA